MFRTGSAPQNLAVRWTDDARFDLGSTESRPTELVHRTDARARLEVEETEALRLNLDCFPASVCDMRRGVSEVTRILDRVGPGDPKAAEELLPLVYEELRKFAVIRMANEKPGQTLQPTALVHEA